MTISRTSIVKGPAFVSFNSVVFFTEGDIQLDPILETFQLNSSLHGGNQDQYLNDILLKVSFSPEGFWAYRSVLCPYHTPTLGQEIFGTTDKDVVIQTLAGKQLTLKAGAVTKMPDINLSAGKALWGGSVELTCIGTNNTAWSNASKRMAITDNAFSESTYATDSKLIVPYTAAWGSSTPWDDIVCNEDGWTVSFELNVVPDKTDTEGTIGMSLESCKVMAKCTPKGIDEDDLLTLLNIQGTGVARGAKLSANKEDLIIQGASTDDPKVTIFNATPKTAGFRFGTTTLRIGEVGFEGLAHISAGANAQLFELTVVS